MTEVMNTALALHNHIFRSLLETYNGYEVKTEGDSFMIAFKKSTSAIQFCIDVQERLLNESWPPALLAHPNCKQVLYSDSNVDSKVTDFTVLFRGLRVRFNCSSYYQLTLY